MDASATPLPRMNELGQPVGPAVSGWSVRPVPQHTVMAGRFCRLEPLDSARHGPALFEAYSLDREGRNWTYLYNGPFETMAALQDWLSWAARQADPLFFAIIDAQTGLAVGVCSYLRIDPNAGSIEVGHLTYSPLLQRTPTSTEAMYLMMRRAFDELGYRRYEWKCDALNAPSRAAAQRLGFRFEGIFRQATIYKGRSRDTAWLSIIDSEWPALKAAFDRWLDPANFDADGRQLQSLSAFQDRPSTEQE